MAPPGLGFGVGLVAASFPSLFFVVVVFPSLCLLFGFSSYIVLLRCTGEGGLSRCLTRPLILSLFVSVFCPAVLLSAQWVVSCTRITCIQPLTRFSLTFRASPFFEESGFCLFVVPLFFSFSPFLSHHVFFLFYWPFRTRLIACLVRAAVLPLSFCLHLFISRCFVIGSSD